MVLVIILGLTLPRAKVYIMKNKFLPGLLRRFPILRSKAAAIIVCSVITIAVLCGFAFVKNSYVITDDGVVTLHYSFSSSPKDILDNMKDPPGADDIVKTEYLENGWHEITITRAKYVHVVYGSLTYDAVAYTETPREILANLSILLDESDTINCDPDVAITGDCTIEVVSGHTEIVTVEESIPFGTQFVTSNAVPDGSSTLVRKGSVGTEVLYYQVTYKDDQEVSRTLLCSEVTADPVDEIIARGTISPISIVASDHNGSDLYVLETNEDGSGTLQLYGQEYSFSKTLSIEATGYSCENDTWRTTYTGTTARVGAVAVDPKFIPLGTKLIIVSDDGDYLYGYCVAEDTGGLIKGNIVDLYFNTDYECWQFGRRNCTAYVIED